MYEKGYKLGAKHSGKCFLERELHCANKLTNLRSLPLISVFSISATMFILFKYYSGT